MKYDIDGTSTTSRKLAVKNGQRRSMSEREVLQP